MKKFHATDDVDPVEQTLCGRPLPCSVDNANPSCGSCLRVIAARLRKEKR